MNKTKTSKAKLVMLFVMFVSIFVMLGSICVVSQTLQVYAETQEEAETQGDAELVEISESEENLAEDSISAVGAIVSSISGTTEDIALQIEMWQDYIDKYIMPNALAVLTSISMVFAVFSKFKSLVALYKEDKDAFDAEKEEIFSGLKTEVANIMETLSDVKQTTLATIDNMPISTIQEDIAKAKEAIEAEMTSLQDFTRMFEIFLASERKLVDTSQLSTSEKLEMKKLFYEGEQLAKKKQTTLADVSDFVLKTISSGEETKVDLGEETSGENSEVVEA